MRTGRVDPAKTVLHFGGLGDGMAGIDYCDSSGRVIRRLRWEEDDPDAVLLVEVHCFEVTRLLRRARRSHRRNGATRGSPGDDGDPEPDGQGSRRPREGAS